VCQTDKLVFEFVEMAVGLPWPENPEFFRAKVIHKKLFDKLRPLLTTLSFSPRFFSIKPLSQFPQVHAVFTGEILLQCSSIFRF
jgi:hypothetical protein